MKSFLPALILTAMATFSFAQQNTSDINPSMVFVQGGTFEMGSTTGVKNERPPHKVTLNSFYVGVYEVTQSLWQRVMGSNPSFFKDCSSCPVEEATPQQVEDFLMRLNTLTGKKFRLPTEAEWEYASRGGPLSKGYRYSGSDSLFEVGWVRDNANSKTHEVGLKKPNELGLYDMSGNVWELCVDWWNPAYYKNSSAQNPMNTKKALFRVTRGGSWRSGEERCYNTARNRNVPDHKKQNCGFRLVLDVEGK